LDDFLRSGGAQLSEFTEHVESIMEMNKHFPDWTEHEDWEKTWWGKKISAEKRQAARLLMDGVAEALVEDMLRLERGQLEAWVKEDEDFSRAATAAVSTRKEYRARDSISNVFSLRGRSRPPDCTSSI
jgi:hypothetical protein